jgi:hypothetical protein
MSPGGYSHVQAETWATLMANSSLDATQILLKSKSSARISKKAAFYKEKLAKELKTQRESLVNAKMIISSLERANNSMMEDLRQRLHDSSTAIASLTESAHKVKSKRRRSKLNWRF